MNILTKTADKLAEAGDFVYTHLAKSAYVREARTLRHNVDTWNENRSSEVIDTIAAKRRTAVGDFRNPSDRRELVSATARTAGWTTALVASGAASIATHVGVWAAAFTGYTAAVRAPKLAVALGVWFPLHVAAAGLFVAEGVRLVAIDASKQVARFAKAAQRKWVALGSKSSTPAVAATEIVAPAPAVETVEAVEANLAGVATRSAVAPVAAQPRLTVPARVAPAAGVAERGLGL